MLQVLVKSEIKIDKYAKEYVTIRFMDTRTIRETNANIWLMDYPSIFNCAISSVFPGAIVTKDVQLYELVDEDGAVRLQSKYTAVVIGDTSEQFFFNELVETKFLRDGKIIIHSPIVSRMPEPKPAISASNPIITPEKPSGYNALSNALLTEQTAENITNPAE